MFYQKIDQHTDITYQATAGAANGLIKSRDFVNLRCWHLCRDGQIVDPSDYLRTPSPTPTVRTSDHYSSSADSNRSFSDALNDEPTASPTHRILPSSRMNKSLSYSRLDENMQQSVPTKFGLSKSVGASGFYKSMAHDGGVRPEAMNNVYVSSAMSVEYSKAPETANYTRLEYDLPII